MTFPTHFVAGMLIGKITGNYAAALVPSVLIDLDHIGVYLRHDVFSSAKKFWETITSPDDPYQGQRSWLHNVLVALVIIGMCFVLFSNEVAATIAIAYGAHVILDAIDGSDFWPLYPSKKINIKGPVKYFSTGEGIVFILLLVTYFVL